MEIRINRMNRVSTVVPVNGNCAPLHLGKQDFFDFASAGVHSTPGNNYSGVLFSIFIPAGTPSGEYDGYFQILGGSDPSQLGSLSNVVEFQVDVVETSAWLLLFSSGSIALFGVVRRRRLLQR